MYRNILSGKIDIPSAFSNDLGDLIKRLLRKDPCKRLGKTRGGTNSVKKHRWFSVFDWKEFVCKHLLAPYKPVIDDDIEMVSLSD